MWNCITISVHLPLDRSLSAGSRQPISQVGDFRGPPPEPCGLRRFKAAAQTGFLTWDTLCAFRSFCFLQSWARVQSWNRLRKRHNAWCNRSYVNWRLMERGSVPSAGSVPHRSWRATAKALTHPQTSHCSTCNAALDASSLSTRSDL